MHADEPNSLPTVKDCVTHYRFESCSLLKCCTAFLHLMRLTFFFTLFLSFCLYFSDPSQQPPDVHPQLPKCGVEHHGEPQN